MTVYGVSLDDVAAQKAFHDEHELGFRLLSDPDGSATDKLGVRSPRGFSKRVTFVVDEAGIVRRVVEDVDVGTHGADLAAWIEAARRGGNR